MVFWVVIGVMVFSAALLLVLPLLRATANVGLRPDYDLVVYREQLKDLEVDKERGVLSERGYKSSRVEIERRMLAAGSSRDLLGHSDPPTARRGWRPAALLCVAVPLCTAFLYYKLGSPGIGDQPFSEGKVVADGQLADSEFDEAVASLTSRLADNPNDLEGWILLARTYVFMERFSDAVSAYQEASVLAPSNIDVLVSLAQFIVASRDGRVTPSAKVEFAKVLRLDPENKIARFFLGLEREQAGDLGAAFEIWSDLSADSGAEDLWLPELRARLQTLAEELDRQPDELGVARDDSSRSEVEEAKIDTPGPSAEDVAAAGQMTEDERGEMIRGMVERLAARLDEEPNDVEGWKRLGNARRVLGESLEAEQAFERALGIDPDDFVALEAQAQIALERAGGGLIPELTQRNYRRILKLDGRRLDALWYLGLAAQQQSRTEEAQDLWQTLLDLLPPDSPDAREVKRRLDEIEG